MIKKEKMKKLLEMNPLLFYVTNVGFVNNTTVKMENKNQEVSPKI